MFQIIQLLVKLTTDMLISNSNYYNLHNDYIILLKHLLLIEYYFLYD